MSDFIINIVLGATVATIVSALVSVTRRWLEIQKSSLKMKFQIDDREIEVSAAHIEELKGFLASFLDKPQVFIGYAFKDKSFAHKLAKDLKENGLRVWMAEDEIRPGDSIAKKIEEGLQKSGYLVALLSEASLESRWAQEEFKMALFREKKGKWPRVIPVLLESVETPPYIRDKLYVDMREDYESGVQQIVKATKGSNAQEKL